MKHILLLIVLYITCPLWAQDDIVFTPINYNVCQYSDSSDALLR